MADLKPKDRVRVVGLAGLGVKSGTPARVLEVLEDGRIRIAASCHQPHCQFTVTREQLQPREDTRP